MAARKYFAATLVLITTVALAPIAFAQTEESPPPVSELTVTVPFPSVAVEPGDQVSFDITVAAPVQTAVALTADGVPDGWTAAFRGGGFEVDSVTAGPGIASEVSFDVSVPAGASEGIYDLGVTAAGAGATVQVPLQIRISAQAGGEVTLVPNFPGLRTPAGSAVTFDVELNNGTPADLEFELASSGPAGWDVTAELAGQAQASTILVEAGGTETINVGVTPPFQAEAAQYPISLQANAGNTSVETQMIVEVVGSYALELSTPDQRLNAEVTVGSSNDFQLQLTNSGSAPLDEVIVGVTPPRDWEVTFDQQTTSVAPGETVIVNATITPSEEAVAGDYVITFTATHEQADDQIEVRTTVSPSALWGFVGIAVIALTLAGLAWVFRRFGRR